MKASRNSDRQRRTDQFGRLLTRQYRVMIPGVTKRFLRVQATCIADAHLMAWDKARMMGLVKHWPDRYRRQVAQELYLNHGFIGQCGDRAMGR